MPELASAFATTRWSNSNFCCAAEPCPLLGVKRTFPQLTPMSA